MTRDATRQCQGSKADGTPCPMLTMTGTAHCWNHQPGRELERQAARRKGGQRGRRNWRATDPAGVDVTSVSGLRVLLVRTIQDTLALPTGVHRSRVMAQLIGVGMDMLRDSDYEQRLAALEARANITGRIA